MFDLGDPVPLSVEVRDTAGALANAGSVALTVTQPDGTSATITNPVAPASTGIYTYSFTPTQAGRHGVRWVATGLNASAFTDAFDVDEAAPTGIVSLSEVRERLNFLATTSDEEIRSRISAATTFFERHLGFPVIRRATSKVVTPDGDGTIRLDGPFISATTITDTLGYGYTYNVASYYSDTTAGVLTPLANTWSGYQRPVTVAYIAGWSAPPEDLRQATLDYIAWKWRSQRGASAAPFQGGDDQFEVFAPATVPNEILEVIDGYKFPVVA